MKNLFKPKSVSGILAEFKKTVKRLDELAMANAAKASEKRAAARKALDEAAALELEAQQAVKSAVSIDRLLQG